MLRLQELDIVESKEQLALIPEGKVLINTINAHSYNVAQKDDAFAMALRNGDYLIPDGASIIKACHLLKAKSQPKERIAGWDLFEFEMTFLNSKMQECKNERMNKCRVMFMGSSEKVLTLIRERVAVDYPNLEVVTYSPPYKPEFSDEDNQTMI
jgi:N-acetylglucosaminyldiphosphoundecaprenol N-acetyl-beta-D-mannosaminyltransferase